MRGEADHFAECWRPFGQIVPDCICVLAIAFPARRRDVMASREDVAGEASKTSLRGRRTR